MIVLDTNVISELMKRIPADAVVGWIATQPATSLYTTSVTQAKILHGIMLLPSGRRRNALEPAAEAMFREDFAGRIPLFGSDAAHAYARSATDRRRPGRPISHFDAQIAGIARSAGAPIATRNVADDDGCGVRVINPWNTSTVGQVL
jgi:predicted nucleic acid-binding protein